MGCFRKGALGEDQHCQAESLLGGAGGLVWGFEGLGAFHYVAESHTELFLLFQVFCRSFNVENNMT